MTTVVNAGSGRKPLLTALWKKYTGTRAGWYTVGLCTELRGTHIRGKKGDSGGIEGGKMKGEIKGREGKEDNGGEEESFRRVQRWHKSE